MAKTFLKPINIPSEVSLSCKDKSILAKGKLGELVLNVHSDVELLIDDEKISFSPSNELPQTLALTGTMRALTKNIIEGVSVGFERKLEINGVGYRAKAQGQKLDLAVGFSHNIVMDLAQEIKVETITEKGQNPIIKLSSFDKQLVGQVAAKIRSFRKPEPYKGKGIRFVGEHIRRKAGKSA